MAARGARPKPAALRLIEGTKQSSPSIPKGTEVHQDPILDLTPPKHLNKYALEMWNKEIDKLEQIGLLGDMDIYGFAALCQAYGEYRNTDFELQELKKTKPYLGGTVIQTGQGEWKSNPLMATHSRNRMEFFRMLQDYGMTPSSRVRVMSLKADPNGKKGKKTDYLD